MISILRTLANDLRVPVIAGAFLLIASSLQAEGPDAGPAVISVDVQNRSDQPCVAHIGDKIDVTISDPRPFVAQVIAEGLLSNPSSSPGAEAATANALPANAMIDALSKMCLFLAGQPFKDINPVVKLAPNASGSGPDVYTLTFALAKTDSNRTLWLGMLQGNGLVKRPTVLTVGYAFDPNDRRRPMDSELDATQFFISPVSAPKLVLSALIMIGLFGAFILLAMKTDLVRDNTSPLNPMDRYPFSLGRCQMAFWTFIVAYAFLFIWVILNEYDSITSSELTLLGISASTGLGSVFIDQINPSAQFSPYITQAERKLRKPAEIKTLLESAQAALGAKRKEIDSKNAEIAGATDAVKPSLQAQLTTMSTAADALAGRVDELEYRKSYFSPGGPFKHFVLDLMQESSTVDFHRFQMVAWTLILGVIFCVAVIEKLGMPEFNETLLTLMGISSGTYIGFKWPAAQKES
jgi:hypothetical protein